jgi:uncharacterized protein (DUF362 family)
VQGVDVDKMVNEAIDLLGGIKSIVHSNDKVVIKPNLTTALPFNTGLTTDPRIVQAIIELCRSIRPSEIIIAEGSGGVDTSVAFERCGYSQLAKKYDIELVDLNESPVTMVDVPEGEAFHVLGVPDIILDNDVVINVPKLKLKRNWATLSVKNLLGAIPGKGEFSGEMWTPEGKWFGPRGEKKRVHTNLDEGLVDLNTVIHPSLNVMDGIIASYEDKPLELGAVLASVDPLALDSIALKIGGLNVFDISYLKIAAERGIGEADHSRIKVCGTPLNEIILKWKSGLNLD